MNEIDRLREQIRQLESELRFDGHPYPEGLTNFPGVLPGQGFFPGGDGLWRNNPADEEAPSFPADAIMILGNDFGCLDNPDPRSPGFMQCLEIGFEDPPTWKIKDTLRKAGIQGELCFFTNAYLGLRTRTETTGESPGAKNKRFKAMCQGFFRYQIEVQKPQLIVCLGHEARRLLAPVLLHDRHIWKRKISFPNLDRQCEQILRGSLRIAEGEVSPVIVVIAHPSYAWSTYAQSPRTFQEQSGEAAEIALLAAAWAMASSV